MDRKLGAFLTILLVAASEPTAAQTPSPLGQWRGTSTCLPVEGNGACQHEIVWYDFTPSNRTPGGLTLDAFKLVGDQYEEMYDLDFRYVAASRDWEGEFSNARVHIVWKYQVTDTGLVGWVEDVPWGLTRRSVHARRAPKPPVTPSAEVEAALREYAARTDSTGLGRILTPDSTRVVMDTAWQWGSYRQRMKVPAGDTVEVRGSFAATWLFSSAKGWLLKKMVTGSGRRP